MTRAISIVATAILLLLSAAVLVTVAQADGPPPGVDTAQRDDVVPEDPEDGLSGTEGGLPGVDTAQRDDWVLDVGEGGTYSTEGGLSDVDDAERDDVVLEEEEGGTTGAEGVDPSVDTAERDDVVPEEEEGGTTGAEGVDPSVDTAQRDDVVPETEEGGASGAEGVLPNVDTAQRDDVVPEGGVTGSASTAPAPTGLRVTTDTDDSVSLSWTGVTNANGYKVEYRKGSTGSWLHAGYAGSRTTYTVSRLTCNTAYQFRVRARGDGSPYSYTYGSPSSGVSETTDACLAPAPTGFKVTSDTDDSVSLSWTAVTDANGYKVEYRKGSTGDWLHAGYAGSRTSYTVSRLTCNTAYQFRVRARGDGSPYSYTYGDPSSSVSETTDACIAPAPTGFKVTSDTDDSVSLSWTAVTDANGYKVEYRKGSTGDWLHAGYAGSRTTYTVRSLACNTAYQFRVRARGDGSPYSYTYGDPSSSVSETTDACIAPAPTGFKVTSDTQTSVNLSWTAVADAGAYKIEYRKGSSGSWLHATYVFSGTAARVGSLECNTSYQFRARTRGDGSPYSYTYGDPSSTVSETTDICSPDPPIGLKVTSHTDTTVTLGWTAVTDAAAYKVEYRESGDVIWLHARYVFSGTSATVGGLDSNTEYEFRVRARGDGSPYSTIYGDPSSSVSETTDAPTISAPSGLKVTSATDTSVTLSWKAVTDAGAYKVEYRKSDASKWLHASYVYTGTSDTVDKLVCNTEYKFRVRARGDGSPYSTTYSTPSSEVTETTDGCPLPPPTGLSISVESGDDDDLDVAYTRSGPPHNYVFELHRSATQNGTYTLADTQNDSSSPADFDDQTVGHWYKARGRNCRTSARTDCGNWSDFTGAIEIPKPLNPPTNLTISVESGDDDDLDVAFTRSGPPHFYEFELHRSATQNGTYTLADTQNDSSSPADFDDQTTGHWYKARGRNCRTAARINCSQWGVWSNTVFLNSSPSFGATSYSFSVREDEQVGGVVGTASATDTDSGDVVAYSITSGNAASLFAINATSGQITVAGGLDYEATDAYTLTVQAEDKHSGIATATVNVTVTNVNEISVSATGDVVEGGDLTFIVTAERGGITATYTIDGTATRGDDYVDPGLGPLTVTVPAGQTNQTIVISTKSDTLDELYESVTITLDGVAVGSGVIDTSDDPATAVIADLISVSSIDDDDSAPPIEIDSTEPMGTVWLKLDTDGGGLFDFNDYDRRAYVLRVEVHSLGSTPDENKWISGRISSAHTKDTGANTYTTLLPSYEDLDYGQIVWVEGSSPPDYRYLLLNVERAPNATYNLDKYRISIAKPDFAVIDRPTLTDSGPTPRDTGNVTLNVTIRNSSEKDSGSSDDETMVDAYCRRSDGLGSSVESTPFADLRPSDSSALLQSKSDEQVQVRIVCTGVAFMGPSSTGTPPVMNSGDSVTGIARVSTDEWTQGWSGDSDKLTAPMNWPFVVNNTLWHPQKTSIVGGLQILTAKGICTLSFPLGIRATGTTGAGTKAVSTTGHCADAGIAWEQGARGSNAISLGMTMDALHPANTVCIILNDTGVEDVESGKKCRRGDQTYATGATSTVAYSIFGPVAENASNKDHGLSIQHFAQHGSLQFKIVGARPPHEDDTVHKVGRTTGWTSGKIWDVEEKKKDLTCPGNALGIGDNHNGKDKDSSEFYYFECSTRASYQSHGGDSGSPVFVRMTANKVILLGVHWGGIGDDGLFVPIERAYAESLLKGYDWLPSELRPLPVLDDIDDDVESLRLSEDGRTIEATFDMREFSHSNAGMTYEAALYRNGVQVAETGGTVYTQEVSRNATGGSPGNIARFDVARIPTARQNGEFTVRVRLCPYTIGTSANTRHCSDYGSAGTKLLKLPPAPQNFKNTGTSETTAQLSWKNVSGATGYEFDYRVKGTSAWLDVKDSVSKSPATITKLSCNTTYEFIVRAYGDGSTYDAKWGFWSSVVLATTAACSDGGTSGQSDSTGPVLHWTVSPGTDHYLIEIPAKGYFVEVPGERSDLQVPSSIVAGLNDHLKAKIWNCHASGLCGLHLETWLPVTPPPAPRTLNLTATHEGLTLSWDTPDDPTVTGYQILRRRPDHGEDKMLVHVPDTRSAETTYTDTTVQPGTRYVYRVKAINGAGVGPRSNSVRITTGSTP